MGTTLLVLGASGIGWYVWATWFSSPYDEGAAAAEVVRVRDEWAQNRSSGAASGGAIAVVSIDGATAPVLVGTSPEVITTGLGWFSQTAHPGQVGNFVVTGLRTGAGPLARIHQLPAGALVEVETRDAIYHYRLSGPTGGWVVDKNQTWVLDPVPGQPGVPPSRALMTVITEAEVVDSPDHTVILAELVTTVRK